MNDKLNFTALLAPKGIPYTSMTTILPFVIVGKSHAFASCHRNCHFKSINALFSSSSLDLPGQTLRCWFGWYLYHRWWLFTKAFDFRYCRTGSNDDGACCNRHHHHNSHYYCGIYFRSVDECTGNLLAMLVSVFRYLREILFALQVSFWRELLTIFRSWLTLSYRCFTWCTGHCLSDTLFRR